MTPEERSKIQQLADNLQIPLYIRDDGKGRLHPYQRPPGERVDPDPKAGPNHNDGSPFHKDEPATDPESG